MNDACTDLTQVIAETDANGTLKKEYTRGLSVISATNGATETSYFITDGQGNIRAIVSGGVVADTYRYDAYGNLIEKTGDSDNDLLYNGEQYSEATGLYYLRARYMDPSTGRFISMDAYSGELGNPTSLHKYLYANANPVMYCDPSGYEATATEELTSMAIAFGLTGALGGAIFGALHADADPDCKGWDRVWRTLISVGSGALGGIIFAYCPYLIGPASLYGMISCRLEAIEAKKNGNTKLAILYNFEAGLSAFSLGGFLGNTLLPRLLEPLGTIPVNTGNYGDTSEIKISNNSGANNGGIGTGNSGTNNSKSGPVKAYEVTSYRDFKARSVKGDGLEGHEMWQHSNIKNNGYADTRLSTDVSKNNPVIALPRNVHVDVNRQQTLFDSKSQTPFENIIYNANIMYNNNNIPNEQVTLQLIEALKHLDSLLGGQP